MADLSRLVTELGQQASALESASSSLSAAGAAIAEVMSPTMEVSNLLGNLPLVLAGAPVPVGAALTGIMDDMSAPYRAATMFSSIVAGIPGPDVGPLPGLVEFTRQFEEAIAPSLAGMVSMQVLVDEVLHPVSTMAAALLRDVEWMSPGADEYDIEPAQPVTLPMSLETREYLCQVVAWYVFTLYVSVMICFFFRTPDGTEPLVAGALSLGLRDVHRKALQGARSMAGIPGPE